MKTAGTMDSENDSQSIVLLDKIVAALRSARDRVVERDGVHDELLQTVDAMIHEVNDWLNESPLLTLNDQSNSSEEQEEAGQKSC